MTEHDRQFDDLERQVSNRFRKDLRGLFEPTGSVPPQVDGAILEQARGRLAKPRRIILRVRWAAGIAAAAVIALGVILYWWSGNRGPSPEARGTGHESRIDLDGNGRVDILDAFRLAKQIESHAPAQANWDINRDGQIDREDVDAIAFAAVRLRANSVGCVPRTKTQPNGRCVVRTLPAGSRLVSRDPWEEDTPYANAYVWLPLASTFDEGV